jgi:hypothetical protein
MAPVNLPGEEQKDLGLGSRVAQQSRLRFLNRDGSFTEFMVFLTALDETFWQTVHTRTSYKPDEIVWGAKFSDIFEQAGDGLITVDLRRIHEIEPAPIS